MAKGCHAVPGVIFRCHNEMFCPGGPAGSCAEGRDVGSVACFHCEQGKKELNLGRFERQDQWIVCIYESCASHYLLREPEGIW